MHEIIIDKSARSVNHHWNVIFWKIHGHSHGGLSGLSTRNPIGE